MRVSLEEVVGNHQPPELTDRIMKALAESPEPVDARTQAILDAARADVMVTPSQAARARSEKPTVIPARSNFLPRDMRRWTGIMVALSVVVFAVLSVMVLIARTTSTISASYSHAAVANSRQNKQHAVFNHCLVILNLTLHLMSLG